MEEEWKTIPDYPAYQVSNFGRVKSFKYKVPRILKPSTIGRGYLSVALSKGNKAKPFLVHRLVARLFIPNPDNKPQVNHKDGCKLNNHVENLEWATRSENQQHAVKIGLKKSGEEHHEAKFTNEQVRYIRANPDSLTQQQLAEMFSVQQATIGYIQLGKRYRHAGGVVRDKIDRRIPDNIREQIRSEYVKGSRKFGTVALSKKYGIDDTTIWRIAHEQR